ncbi:hypothetical protein AXG93_3719s1520 [Marchantia polymorpha subsp. ruderalis]|uniref:Uncharacterized protein n=1 Tax=Marchantia polymorpha subsp. ruderalis TaxID=1480154 RepID=A0A176VP43_MARPO|nr:hypothetical protein AXG93_3719s1520 [Marchantia polymorpha subsp. ruderalis]
MCASSEAPTEKEYASGDTPPAMGRLGKDNIVEAYAPLRRTRVRKPSAMANSEPEDDGGGRIQRSRMRMRAVRSREFEHARENRRICGASVVRSSSALGTAPVEGDAPTCARRERRNPQSSFALPDRVLSSDGMFDSFRAGAVSAADPE